MYGMVTSHSSARPHRSPDSTVRVSASGTASGGGGSRGAPRGPQSIYRRLVNVVKQAWTGVRFSLDGDQESFEANRYRNRSKGIDALCRSTKFSRKELQRLYRGFKQACPNGMVREETLRDIYARFFPYGDTSFYSHYLFKTFEPDSNGEVTFEDFALGLSVLLRGSMDEKLRWTFNLYDINRDGYISKEEMLAIVSSIYSLLGSAIEPQVDENTARNHVDRVFQKLDINQDGVVTIDEFVEFCTKDDAVNRAMCMFEAL